MQVYNKGIRLVEYTKNDGAVTRLASATNLLVNITSCGKY